MTRQGQKAASGETNSVRIIAGQWRSRKLTFPTSRGLRPTGDRLRETLFNWLAPEVVGARCLDLFAGAGALGFEALSRGAKSVLMLERDRDVCKHLISNKTLLQAEAATLLCVDSIQWLAQTHAERFDIVFIDPPFEGSLLEKTLALLGQHNLLNSSAFIYIESPSNRYYQPPGDWTLRREKKAGAVSARLWRGPVQNSNC